MSEDAAEQALLLQSAGFSLHSGRKEGRVFSGVLKIPLKRDPASCGGRSFLKTACPNIILWGSYQHVTLENTFSP